jgi:hypothetical protein
MTVLLKTFFKTLKHGRKSGTIADVFITGVLPITIDDMASGYNIANFITFIFNTALAVGVFVSD